MKKYKAFLSVILLTGFVLAGFTQTTTITTIIPPFPGDPTLFLNGAARFTAPAGGGAAGTVINTVVTSGLLAVGSSKTNGIAATAAHITNAWGVFTGSATDVMRGDGTVGAVPGGGGGAIWTNNGASISLISPVPVYGSLDLAGTDTQGTTNYITEFLTGQGIITNLNHGFGGTFHLTHFDVAETNLEPFLIYETASGNTNTVQDNFVVLRYDQMLVPTLGSVSGWSGGIAGSVAIIGNANQSGNNANIGVIGESGSANLNVGVLGYALPEATNQVGFGVVGVILGTGSSQTVAGMFYISDSFADPVQDSAALVADSGGTGFPIFKGRNNNGSTVMQISSVGLVSANPGFSSLATDAAVAISATGWTNSFGKLAVIAWRGTAASATIYNNSGTATSTNTTVVGQTGTIILQASGKFIITAGTAISGVANPL